MQDPIVVAMELPTPDVVVVAEKHRRPLVLVDPRVSRDTLHRVLADLGAVLAGPAYPLYAS